MTIKELFDKAENGTLTYEQFTNLTKTGNAKFTDLSEGSYVSKQKYDDDIQQRDTQIQTLNTTISTRDTDLQSLKDQLAAAGTDATKLSDLTNQLNTLQGKYDTDTRKLQNQLTKQEVDFAIRDYTSGLKFTSQAARRDFVNSMTAKGLKADDFRKLYATDNPDAFVVENPAPATPPTQATPPSPSFVSPTTPTGAGGQNSTPFNFNFTGVRPHDNK